MSKKYHHGDLPAALLATSAALIAECGPTGFSLREVARRAGVSHAAPAHHFGSTTGLLTSVAIEGQQWLSKAFGDAVSSAEDPLSRLTALGRAYVSIALSNPGHFSVMCSKELVDAENPDLVEASGASYTYLLDTITAIAAAHNPDLDVEAAAGMTWSAVHGLALLITNMPLVSQEGVEPEIAAAELIDRFVDLMFNGYAKR